MPTRNPVASHRLRAMLRGILGLGLAGTAAELLLISHYEGPRQWAPLVVIGLAFASLLHHASRGGGVRVFRAAMLALMATGVAGFVLHHLGNREFQLELDPSLGGIELFLKVLRAKAPPALAPGSLVVFGMLGLASTYEPPVPPPPSPSDERSLT